MTLLTSSLKNQIERNLFQIYLHQFNVHCIVSK
jgi:hypothetical protein